MCRDCSHQIDSGLLMSFMPLHVMATETAFSGSGTALATRNYCEQPLLACTAAPSSSVLTIGPGCRHKLLASLPFCQSNHCIIKARDDFATPNLKLQRLSLEAAVKFCTIVKSASVVYLKNKYSMRQWHFSLFGEQLAVAFV